MRAMFGSTPIAQAERLVQLGGVVICDLRVLRAQLEAIARPARVGFDDADGHVEARTELETGLAAPEADAGVRPRMPDVFEAAGRPRRGRCSPRCPSAGRRAALRRR